MSDESGRNRTEVVLKDRSSVTLACGAVIRLMYIGRNKVILGIEAPPEVRIDRAERLKLIGDGHAEGDKTDWKQ